MLQKQKMSQNSDHYNLNHEVSIIMYNQSNERTWIWGHDRLLMEHWMCAFWDILDIARFVNLLHAELIGLVDHSHSCKECIHVKKSDVYKFGGEDLNI